MHSALKKKIFNKYTGCIISKNKATECIYIARFSRVKIVKFLNYEVFNFILYFIKIYVKVSF